MCVHDNYLFYFKKACLSSQNSVSVNSLRAAFTYNKRFFEMIQYIVFTLIALVIDSGESQTFQNYEVAHIGLIGWTNPNNGIIVFDCTGSYIGKNVIMTGARCLDRNGTRADIVRLGTAMGTPRDFHIENITIHYRYEAEYYYHNMALIFLKENPQSVSNKFKPACILSVQPSIDTKVYVLGRDSDGVYQKTPVELVTSDKCHEYYTPTKKFKYGALLVCCMCARNAATNNCATELSSPMQTIMTKNGKHVPFLVGQKTIGKSCGSKIPGIYTRLSSDGHFPWITTVSAMNFKDHEVCIERY
ncbi:serine protease Hayan-like [Wyeomyia smithii]|uniref:serine protease Hayan-like n=1 Tax=Wyeomyia smithii TaxID=174621 RepID=UPI0024681EEA|nr:serine protease Hayan-like [Wyeomyia smithii]